MNNRISRRDLFVKGAKSTAAISLASVVLPQAARGASGEELATLIDLGKCIGCESCVYAC